MSTQMMGALSFIGVRQGGLLSSWDLMGNCKSIEWGLVDLREENKMIDDIKKNYQIIDASPAGIVDDFYLWVKSRLFAIYRSLIIILLLLGLGVNFCWADGMKGGLSPAELAFIQGKVFPVLIEYGYCARASGDCLGDYYVTCLSYKSLACNVWGVTNRRAIFAITRDVLSSNLRVSRFVFWRSRYKKKGIFERPLLSLDINMQEN
jgi:hypothetical protein